MKAIKLCQVHMIQKGQFSKSRPCKKKVQLMAHIISAHDDCMSPILRQFDHEHRIPTVSAQMLTSAKKIG